MMITFIILQIPLEQFHWTPKQLFRGMLPGSIGKVLYEKFKKGEIEGGNDPFRRCFAYGKKMEEMEQVQIEVEIKMEGLKPVLPEYQNKMRLLENLYLKILTKKDELNAAGRDIDDIKADEFRKEATDIENFSQEELETHVWELIMNDSDNEEEEMEEPILGVEFLVDTSEEEEEGDLRRVVRFGQ